ncbi:hypothetical protein RMSM_07655 [Rhodopirellula maiorica SM1]|uniref:Uncharacterized protein n=1 Tax=Rhodopirellula maiorica SM1 TaxID=1265738 RepID=M5R8Q1_9BACT|nr:hypothetical protein RMSM_07655 [Rhodopirellula maiorica SM1]
MFLVRQQQRREFWRIPLPEHHPIDAKVKDFASVGGDSIEYDEATLRLAWQQIMNVNELNRPITTPDCRRQELTG